MAGFFTGIFVLLSVYFMVPLLSQIPIVIISSTVIFSVVRAIEFHEVIFLFKAHPNDLCMFILAFMSTLFLGVAEGVMICIAVSLLIIVKKGSIPYWSL